MVRRVVPLTRRYGIRPVGFFILGFPWEDPQATDATLQLMRDLSPYIVFQPAIASILVPFPGTEIYDRYKDEYGFAQWWTSDDRTYDAPRIDTHPFYQTVMYRMGVVLDADFFRYTPRHEGENSRSVPLHVRQQFSSAQLFLSHGRLAGPRSIPKARCHLASARARAIQSSAETPADDQQASGLQISVSPGPSCILQAGKLDLHTSDPGLRYGLVVKKVALMGSLLVHLYQTGSLPFRISCWLSLMDS